MGAKCRQQIKMNKIKLDPFVPTIIACILLAYFFPQLADAKSKFPLEEISNCAVSLVFFFYGLKLSKKDLVQGLSNWPLHLLVQASTFIIFPLLVIFWKPFVTSENLHQWWLAFLFLAALPSTVSSSVVMVSMARGNVVAAIFNASISGLLGIVFTPLWVGFYLKGQTSNFDLSQVYLKLLLEILTPMLLGFLLQKYWGVLAQQHKSKLALFDKMVILLIIYKSFAESFIAQIFDQIKVEEIFLVFVLVTILFAIQLMATKKTAKIFKLNTPDSITLQFCGTKKSLVQGTVFSKLLFPATMPIGILLLPLMMYHALQIFWISILAGKLGQRALDS